MGLRFLRFVGCIAAVLVVALPAAANSKPSSGAPIPLGDLGPMTFPANTPFHIEHGTYTFVGVHTLDGIPVLTRTKTITFN